LVRMIVSTLLGLSVLLSVHNVAAAQTHTDHIERLLAQMSIPEKVGQMVMAGIPGYSLTPEAVTLIKQNRVGGIMLAVRNIQDAQQSARLVTSLQGLATQTGLGVPLLIAADQEGGYVARLRGPYLFPGNMALGATRSPELVRQVAYAMGMELRSAGINMNFGPVLDVNSNPDNPVIGVRSFGENPTLVASLGSAYIAGMHDADVLTTAKHFPGHGDTAQDSHIALPTVYHPYDRLQQVELYPFKQAIAEGIDAIMTAHVTFPAIEPTNALPATLSTRVLTDLLRKQMGFTGLIITDSMGMAAITQKYGMADAAVLAVQAGADIVLTASGWNDVTGITERLLAAVQSGVISMERIDESVRRILQAKQRLGLWESVSVTPLSKAQYQEIAAASAAAAAQSITLVRDLNQRLPIGQKAGRVLVIMATASSVSGVEETTLPTGALAKALSEYLPQVAEIQCESKPNTAARKRIVDQAVTYDTVILATYYAWSPAYVGQVQLLDELMVRGKEPIVVAMREPYDLRAFPSVGTFLAAYSTNPESATAVARVLVGKQSATGRLPVSIPGLYPAGW
jgi:beta-N-acetylhexosaminidase